MTDFDRETGEVREPDPTMPPAVAAAIIKVKMTVVQLGYDERNEHARYPYVSVDKFYDQIGRKMAEAGLFVIMDETHAEVRVREGAGERGTSAWLHVQYSIYMGHASGAMWGPVRRRVFVVANGPQAYGSAQSYLEKQFLRALFKIPTGEKDEVDQDPQKGLPQQRQAVTKPQSAAADSPAKPTNAPAAAAATVPPAAAAPHESENPAPVFEEAPGRVTAPPSKPAPAAKPGAPVDRNSQQFKAGLATFVEVKQKLRACRTKGALTEMLGAEKARLDEVAELGPEAKKGVQGLLAEVDALMAKLPEAEAASA